MNYYNIQSTGPGSKESPNEELKEEVEKECQRRREWMMLMDVVEQSQSLLDRDRLLELLSNEQQEEVKRADDEDRWTTLMVLLRRREDLMEDVRCLLSNAGISLQNQEQSPKSVSTVRYETRLRTAALQLHHLDGLPDSTLRLLFDVGCLSRQELRQVKNGELRIASLPFNHLQLHLLISILRRRHPDIHTALCAAFVDPPQSRVFLHNVPEPPQPCVQRVDLLTAVRQWMLARARAKPSPRVLLLRGIGGGGKSYVAASAASEALRCGFHRVLWIDALCGRLGMLQVAAQHLSLPRSVYSLSSEELLKEELRQRMEELKSRGERVLMIVDDLVNNDDFLLLRQFDAVISTSRIRSICLHREDTERIDVHGLTSQEIQDLMQRLLKNTYTAVQARPRMWTRLQTLFDGGYNLPLCVKLLGRLVQKDQQKWRTDDDAVQYVEEMKERLMNIKTAFNARQVRPHSGEFFEHANVYASIQLSIERLSKDGKQKFKSLVIFERGEAISPISTSTMWRMKTGVAEDRLEDFVNCSLLVENNLQLGQRLFLLNNLIHDLLRWDTSDEQMQKLTRDVVEAYNDRLSSVDRRDAFFYLRYVGLCLRIGEAEKASRCLCRLDYVIDRIQNGWEVGLLDDFDNTAAHLPSDQRLSAFRRLVTVSLPIAIEKNDAEVVLRAAVARHHEEPFRGAVIEAKKRRHRHFLKVVCPREGEIEEKVGVCHPVIGKTGEDEIVTSLRWDEYFHDFVSVKRDREGGICVHPLLRTQQLLESDRDPFPMCRAASCGQRVTRFDERKIDEWQLTDNKESRRDADWEWELPADLRCVVDVTYSIGRGDLYALCRSSDDTTFHLLRREAQELRSIVSLKALKTLTCMGIHKTKVWACDESRVFIIFSIQTFEIWSLEGIPLDSIDSETRILTNPLRRIEDVQGFRMNEDGRRLAVWSGDVKIRSTTSCSIEEMMRSTSSKTEEEKLTSLMTEEEKLPSSMMEEEQLTSSMMEELAAQTFLEHVHPDWNENDPFFGLIIFDLSTAEVIFSTKDKVLSTCFSQDGNFAFLTDRSVHVASTVEVGRMAVTRSRLWSGGDNYFRIALNRFGREKSHSSLLHFSKDKLLILTGGRSLLRMELESGEECLLWDFRFVEETDRGVGYKWAVDPQNSAVALTFDYARKLFVLKRIDED